MKARYNCSLALWLALGGAAVAQQGAGPGAAAQTGPTLPAPELLAPPADAPAVPKKEQTTSPQQQGQGNQQQQQTQQQNQQQQQQQQQQDKRECLRDCHMGPENCYWGGADYLQWWVKKGSIPVDLVTTGVTGIPGDPGTTTLLGNAPLDYESFSGVRADLGRWLGERHVWGVEVGGFVLFEKTVNQSVSTDGAGFPALFRPVVDVGTNPPVTSTPLAIIIGAPGIAAGSFDLSSSSELWGAEGHLVRNLAATPEFSADLLLGVRYLNLREDLVLSQHSTALGGNVLLPASGATSVAIEDRFLAFNHFYGGQVGGRFEYRYGPFALGAVGTVALGPNHEQLDVSGSTVGTGGNPPLVVFPTGVLAVNGANVGRAGTNWFTVVPEVRVELTVQVTRGVLAHVGYDFLYVQSVVRPGDQLNNNVNFTTLSPLSPFFGFVGGPAAPPAPFNRTDFWAQGAHAGLEVRF